MSTVANRVSRAWSELFSPQPSPQEQHTGPRLVTSTEPPSTAIPDSRCQFHFADGRPGAGCTCSPRQKSPGCTCSPRKSMEPSATALDSRCKFYFADGRRCRAPRCEEDPALCLRHAHALSQAPEMIDLAPPSGEFRTATDVNRALGKVFLLLAQNRIPRRNAVALGYLAQLLLQTLPAVRQEIVDGQGYQAWTETLQSAFSQNETPNETEDDAEDKSRAPADSSLEAAANGASEARVRAVLAARDKKDGAAQPVPAGTAQASPARERWELRREGTLKPRRGDTISRSNSEDEVCLQAPLRAAPGIPSAARTVAQTARPAPNPVPSAQPQFGQTETSDELQPFANEHLQNWGRGRGRNPLIPNRNKERVIWSGDGRHFRLGR